MFKSTKLFTQLNNAFVSRIALEFHSSSVRFAGHSKWANIKHIKALKDGQRAVLFQRMARNIRLAIQEGGSVNPEFNPTLKIAIQEAAKRDMPNSSIQTVLKKYAGQSEKLQRYFVELKHGQKVFIVLVLYTDNFTHFKTLLGTVNRKMGCTYTDTRHMFCEKGIVEVVGNETLNSKTPEELEEIATEHAIECEAEEFEIIDANAKHLTFICEPAELQRVKQKISALGYNIESAEHVFIPNNEITLTSDEQAWYEKTKEKFMAVDGVDTIYDNVAE
ncbi:putative transcriptional regulatory protein [Pseudolycoriella hygida]|uniref:Transcriptional regulatory protein n=1 Tax=Pseudolycoriella hygida TaxID=35572 RepID=A0A9Q0N1S7_9DIPT|nr:putative transcriptional regulatory protein [Pseudolycoriella hygida]